MPQALKTVISEFKLNLFIVITVAKRVEIGIVITKTWGKFKIIIIMAMLKGMPYKVICLINWVKVSDAKMIEVKIITPKTKTSKSCFTMYSSKRETESNPFCLNNLLYALNFLCIKVYFSRFYHTSFVFFRQFVELCF